MPAAYLFEPIVAMLVAVSALYWLADRAGWPPSATLLVGGAAIAFVPGVPAVRLDPALVLVLFLPPLLSDGAWFTEQAQELAPHSHALRQDRGVLPRLCQSRISTALAAPCPRSLVVRLVDRGSPAMIGTLRGFLERQRLFGVVLLPPLSDSDQLARLCAELGCRYVRTGSAELDAADRMVASETAGRCVLRRNS